MDQQLADFKGLEFILLLENGTFEFLINSFIFTCSSNTTKSHGFVAN